MKTIFDVVAFVIAVIIPAIPGLLLWLLLAPSGYYQMLTSVVLGIVLYVIVCGLMFIWANR